MLLIQLIVLLVASSGSVRSGLVNLCSSVKECKACADSFIYILGSREFCRWCADTETCGGPFACTAGSGVVQREPFMCPTPANNTRGFRYTDKIGRSLFSLALAVKESNPTECLANSRPDVKLIKRYEVECDQSHNRCAAMLAVSEAAKSIYVVFKSSNMDKQIITEFIHTIAAQFGAWEKFESGGGVIMYFHGAFERLFKQSGMKENLLNLTAEHPDYRVWTTGHSLGGSLAAMTALYLVQKDLVSADHVRLVTFGEPRTGNVLFAKAVEENVRYRYRVVNRNDLMTNVPAAIDPNGILLTKAYAERQPHFYRYLIAYDDNTQPGELFKVCDISEDYACRNLALATNVLDHTSYFGINADEYFTKKCKSDLLKLHGTNKTDVI